jgi:hypothetical protein
MYVCFPSIHTHHVTGGFFFPFQLFVPSVGVFGIGEIIPFHLQLFGSTRSLRNLLLCAGPQEPAIIRVYLLRQIIVEVGPKPDVTKMSTILREGSLTSIPPDFNSRSDSDEVLNWAGELPSRGYDTPPSFDAGGFKVTVGF